LGIGYRRFLNWNMKQRVYEKQLTCNTLGRFGGFCPEDACALESCFVNHALLVFRISLSQGVSPGRLSGVPT
jgi:hypothetical protein